MIDWKEIALLGMFLIFAVLMAHGWPVGDWQLGWAFLSAVGGIVAGGAAFYAAKVALKVSETAEKRHVETMRLDSSEHLRVLKTSLHDWIARINGRSDIGLGWFAGVYIDGLWYERGTIGEVMLEMNNSIDLRKLYHLDPLLVKAFDAVLGVFYQVSNPHNPRNTEQFSKDATALRRAFMILATIYQASLRYGKVDWLNELKALNITTE